MIGQRYRNIARRRKKSVLLYSLTLIKILIKFDFVGQNKNRNKFTQKQLLKSYMSGRHFSIKFEVEYRMDQFCIFFAQMGNILEFERDTIIIFAVDPSLWTGRAQRKQQAKLLSTTNKVNWTKIDYQSTNDSTRKWCNIRYLIINYSGIRQ